MRTSEVKRKTNETDIVIQLNLDGTGKSEVDSGVGFLDHMLENFARHGSFDLNVICKGDTHIDNHHTTEDIGICLGDAFARAIGQAQGILRYGDVTLPMDEALVMCAVDISGRSYLGFNVNAPAGSNAGGFDMELLEEFLIAFVRKAGITVHIRLLDGKNTHHIIEAAAKAVARALAQAVALNPRILQQVPSTKGSL